MIHSRITDNMSDKKGQHRGGQGGPPPASKPGTLQVNAQPFVPGQGSSNNKSGNSSSQNNHANNKGKSPAAFTSDSVKAAPFVPTTQTGSTPAGEFKHHVKVAVIGKAL